MVIKSITDVITNSSSEAYTVKVSVPGLSESQILDIFKQALRKQNYRMSDEEYENYVNTTWDLFPSVYTIDDWTFELSWSVLCNVNDCEELLKKTFGEDNVKWLGR